MPDTKHADGEEAMTLTADQPLFQEVYWEQAIGEARSMTDALRRLPAQEAPLTEADIGQVKRMAQWMVEWRPGCSSA